MLQDAQKIEYTTLKGLEKYGSLMVKLPKSQKEFDERFSLKNDEISIDEVEFEDIDINNLSGLMVKLPRTQEEFDRRFRI